MKDSIVVNCKTKEEAIELFKYLIQNCYEWITGEGLRIEDCDWIIHKESTCYHIHTREKLIAYSQVFYYRSRGAEILTYQQFKELIK